MQPRDLRASVGFSVSWDSPVGPLRFSLGYPRKDGGEEINANVRITKRPLAETRGIVTAAIGLYAEHFTRRSRS